MRQAAQSKSARRLSFTSVVFGLAWGFSFTAVAHQDAGCGEIDEPLQRLACYDEHHVQAESEDAPITTDLREELIAADTTPSLIRRRQSFEAQQRQNWFSITPHRPNYILPATYNDSPNFSRYGDIGDAFNPAEVKFQLSLKTEILSNLWRRSSVAVGYTQQSYWQVYANEEASSPFRETNHEPEITWSIPVDFNVLGWHARLVTLELNHQSNGRSNLLSRSWNRVIGQIVFEKGNFVVSARGWKRIEEDAEDDDNPNIEDFMGRVRLGVAYKYGEQTFSLGHKNGLGDEYRGGTELNWSFPLLNRVRGVVQVYSGYGENLIDMEEYTNRIGVGVMLTDWL